MAQKAGESPEKVAQAATAKAGYTKEAAKLTAAERVRNLDIAGKLGCLDADGLAKMRRGNAAIVRTGPYAGDIASIDHIIPRAVAPELDNCIANLELLPLRVNESKNDKIGDRQLALAKRFHAAGLLSEAGFERLQGVLAVQPIEGLHDQHAPPGHAPRFNQLQEVAEASLAQMRALECRAALVVKLARLLQDKVVLLAESV
jgi:hypothetical protein